MGSTIDLNKINAGGAYSGMGNFNELPYQIPSSTPQWHYPQNNPTTIKGLGSGLAAAQFKPLTPSLDSTLGGLDTQSYANSTYGNMPAPGFLDTLGSAVSGMWDSVKTGAGELFAPTETTGKEGVTTTGPSQALQWGNFALGLGSYLTERDKLEMYEKQLQDQLKNSELARSQTADDLINQAGVRGSLAGAFGADTSSYDGVAERYKQYQTPTKSTATQVV